MIVNLFILPWGSATAPSGIKFPGANTNCIIMAPNTYNSDIKFWKASLEFIGARYMRSDKAYGRIVDYIIGNEVDAADIWNNMGNKEITEYAEQYAIAMRTAYVALRKSYVSPRVYLCFTSGWSVPYTTNSWKYYATKQVLDEFNYIVKSEGDFPWNIAYHAYPSSSNLTNPWPDTVWNDDKSANNINTTNISCKNINILLDYINNTNIAYHGSNRWVILSEQGFSCPTGAYGKSISERSQAAEYVYSYLKSSCYTQITGFAYWAQVDPLSPLWFNGIWSRLANGNRDPNGIRYIHSSMELIDTAQRDNNTQFAKGIIGISNYWSEICTNWSGIDTAFPWGVNNSARNDYNGDGKSDLADFTTDGHWYIKTLRNTCNAQVIIYGTLWGYSKCVAVPGDYDGDGVADLAVFDGYRNNSNWYIRTVSGTTLLYGYNWGYSNCVAVSGDYNGDGKYDLAVYDRSQGKWYACTTSGVVILWNIAWGGASMVAVPGDYDGDGISDMAVWDTSSYNWYIRTVSGTTLAWSVSWGGSGMVPVSGDFDGDGISDLALYHSASGMWFIRKLSPNTLLAWYRNWGGGSAGPVVPLAGDYDGDGSDDMAVYYKNNGAWFIESVATNRLIDLGYEYWGNSTMTPVTGL